MATKKVITDRKYTQVVVRCSEKWRDELLLAASKAGTDYSKLIRKSVNTTNNVPYE